MAAALLVLARLSYGTTLANHGLDRPGCGTQTSPCRSITQGITLATAGDTIIVGPGVYGDRNRNGTVTRCGQRQEGLAC